MDSQSIHERLANLILLVLEIETDLLIASRTKNRELSDLTKKLLSKIADNREERWNLKK